MQALQYTATLEEENKEIANRYKDLLKGTYEVLSKEDKELIRKAFDIAVDAHSKQRRKTGEPYIFHPIAVAKIVASLREITPVAIGRCAVRFINLSVSLSITMLKAFALPAAKVPPRIVAIDSPTEGMPFWARTRAGKVVTSKSSTTRNFMRSR